MASEIDDPKIWREFANNLVPGIYQLVASFQPDVVIIGGGVGAHFEKFGPFLTGKLDEFKNKLVKMPPIIKAGRSEEGVVYGCYDYYKQQS